MQWRQTLYDWDVRNIAKVNAKLGNKQAIFGLFPNFEESEFFFDFLRNRVLFCFWGSSFARCPYGDVFCGAQALRDVHMVTFFGARAL